MGPRQSCLAHVIRPFSSNLRAARPLEHSPFLHPHTALRPGSICLCDFAEPLPRSNCHLASAVSVVRKSREFVSIPSRKRINFVKVHFTEGNVF